MIVVLSALRQELDGLFEGLPVVWTGVGKVNAVCAATGAILLFKPKLIVNFGSAGSNDVAPGSLLNCTQFVQYDIDCSPLGVLPGETPFETVPARLEVPNRVPWLPKARCLTLDRFVTAKLDPEKGIPELYDMEAYAIAKACFYGKTPFVSVKYVSDSGSADEWKANCSKGAKLFREVYDRLLAGTT